MQTVVQLTTSSCTVWHPFSSLPHSISFSSPVKIGTRVCLERLKQQPWQLAMAVRELGYAADSDSDSGGGGRKGTKVLVEEQRNGEGFAGFRASGTTLHVNVESLNGSLQGRRISNARDTSKTMEGDVGKIFIGNLPYHIKREPIKTFFSQCGPVRDIIFIRSHTDPEKNRGYCFLFFGGPDPNGAAVRAAEFDGVEFHGKTLRIKLDDGRWERDRRGERERWVESGAVSCPKFTYLPQIFYCNFHSLVCEILREPVMPGKFPYAMRLMFACHYSLCHCIDKLFKPSLLLISVASYSTYSTTTFPFPNRLYSRL